MESAKNMKAVSRMNPMKMTNDFLGIFVFRWSYLFQPMD
jgi:hypothetical protein